MPKTVTLRNVGNDDSAVTATLDGGTVTVTMSRETAEALEYQIAQYYPYYDFDDDAYVASSSAAVIAQAIRDALDDRIDPATREVVKVLLEHDRKIQAIKYLRDAVKSDVGVYTNTLSLKEAKDIVDEIDDDNGNYRRPVS